jgi:hypothetical protein
MEQAKSNCKLFWQKAVVTTVLLSAAIWLTTSAQAATQIDIVGPTGSGQFSTSVTVLSNGNFVVTDPGFDSRATDIGAVYLYNGQTLCGVRQRTTIRRTTFFLSLLTIL